MTHRRILLPLFVALACSPQVEESQPEIPPDIYDEGVWDDAEVEVRIAALRRDIRTEMQLLASLSERRKAAESGRLLELMSALRAEWGKLEGGAEDYARLEEEVDALLEEPR
jgi:hypothetical protein